MEQDLVFLDVAAQHGHLCHAPGGEQARADDPVGQGAQVEHRRAVGRQAHDEQFAEDGRLRPQRGIAHIVGKGVGHRGQFLRHDLAGQVNVRVPVKFHPHDGKSRGGRGAHTAHAGGSVDGGLDGKCDQLFHLFGRHAPRFGHDDHGGGVQVGKHIDFRVESLVQSAHQQQHRGDQDEQPVLQRKMDDFVQHVFLLLLINGNGCGQGWRSRPRPASRASPLA